MSAVQDEIRTHCEKHGLPVEVITVYPSLASSFVVSTVGRGTLPRFPENGRDRACSVDWKVLPQKRLSTELQATAAQQNVREPITVIGTRFAESTVRRSRMTGRGESHEAPVRDADGRLVISIIAQWSLQDVWDTLEMLLEPESCPYLHPSARRASQGSLSFTGTLMKDSAGSTWAMVATRRRAEVVLAATLAASSAIRTRAWPQCFRTQSTSTCGRLTIFVTS